MNTTFVEYTPHHELIPYIQSFWTGHFNIDNSPSFRQSVLPNGCIELIIHLDEDHCRLASASGWSKSPEFTILGLYEKPYEVLFSESVKVFGIRFYPDGIKNVFGVNPAEFIATYEDGLLVLDKSFASFCGRVRESAEAAGQVVLANEYLLQCLSKNKKYFDRTHLTMSLIREIQGVGEFRTVTDKIPVSLRQLQREFKSTYGITISDYMRLSRMSAINRYMSAGYLSLTELSHELEFTDQSHFIREFRNYTGVAPKMFFKSKEHFIVNPVAY